MSERHRQKYSRKAAAEVLILLLITLSGCGGGDAAAPAGVTGPAGMQAGRGAVLSVAVKTQEIVHATIEEYAKISCQVQAENEVNVTPKVSGTVEAVHVSVGDTVQAGDVLFEVDRSTLERQLAQANASYVQAQVNYDAALNGSLDHQLATLQASVKDRQYAYQNALRDYENNKILFDSGAVTRTELDSAESTMESRKSDLESAERALALYENSTMQGDLKMLEATLAQARASYESALQSLDDASVKAEISGVVSYVGVSVGNNASAQGTAVRIVNMDRAKLAFGVTDKVINQVQVGSRAEITISALSDEPFEGQVSAVSPAADSQSLLYPVEIYIDNPDQLIKPGMFAMVKLAVDKHENTISLPVDAVIEKNNEAHVFVVGDDLTVSKATVETGLRNDQYIEVVAGLEMGDIVVIVGQDFLNEGNQANITEGPSPAGTPAAAPAEPSAESMPPGALPAPAAQ